MAVAATPAAASDSAAPPALLGDDAEMTDEEADDMLEDQCLHPIVMPHDAARAEIEAAVAEDVPDGKGIRYLCPCVDRTLLRLMAVILSTICKAYLDSVAAINPVGAKELSGTNIETET